MGWFVVLQGVLEMPLCFQVGGLRQCSPTPFPGPAEDYSRDFGLVGLQPGSSSSPVIVTESVLCITTRQIGGSVLPFSKTSPALRSQAPTREEQIVSLPCIFETPDESFRAGPRISEVYLVETPSSNNWGTSPFPSQLDFCVRQTEKLMRSAGFWNQATRCFKWFDWNPGIKQQKQVWEREKEEAAFSFSRPI